MAPKLYFLGTGNATARGELSEGGFLLEASSTLVCVDPGAGAAFALKRLKINSVDACVITDDSRAHDSKLIKSKEIITKSSSTKNIKATFLNEGVKFTLADGIISYITKTIDLREVKRFFCDVLILFNSTQSKELIEKIKPTLTILTGFSNDSLTSDPLYTARLLQQETSCQVIAARDDLVVNLVSYGALSVQKGLAKFTK